MSIVGGRFKDCPCPFSEHEFDEYQDGVIIRLLEFLEATGIPEGQRDGIVDWIIHEVTHPDVIK